MPSLPWIEVRSAEPVTTRLVLASRLQLISRRDVPAFFVDALRIHRQVRRSPGAVGVALVAHLWRGQFFTLSSWVDEAAMSAMVGTQPHSSIMGRYHDRIADSQFVTWQATATPSWSDAHARLSR